MNEISSDVDLFEVGNIWTYFCSSDRLPLISVKTIYIQFFGAIVNWEKIDLGGFERTKDWKNGNISENSIPSYSNVHNTTFDGAGYNWNLNFDTIPKDPPPPRRAQNKSEFNESLTVKIWLSTTPIE